MTASDLGPQGGGQHDVGVAVGRGVAIGVLGDDQLGRLEPGDHGRRGWARWQRDWCR